MNVIKIKKVVARAARNWGTAKLVISPRYDVAQKGRRRFAVVPEDIIRSSCHS